MAATGKRSDLDFKVSTNAEKAISDMARIIARQDGMIKKTRQSATEARKSQRQMSKAMKKMEQGGDKAAKSTDKVKNGLSGIGNISKKTAGDIRNYVNGFAGLTSAALAMRAIVEEMRQVAELKKKFFDSAVTRDQMTKETAVLFGDLSAKTKEKIAKTQDELAAEFSIPVRSATDIYFDAVSKWGPTEKAKTSAKVIAGLTSTGTDPAATTVLHSAFDWYNANDEKQMKSIANQFINAAGRSVATQSQYADAFSRVAPLDAARGIPIDETFGYLSAYIDKSPNPTKAAETYRITRRGAVGNTKKSTDWLSDQAAADELDFTAMDDSQRMDFTVKVVQDYIQGGKFDDLKSIFDSRALVGLQMAATDSFQRVKTDVETNVQKALKDNLLDKLVSQERQSPTALKTRLDSRKLNAQADAGLESRALVDLDERVDAILEIHKGNSQGVGAWAMNALVPDYVQRHDIAREIMIQNLGAKYENTSSKYEKNRIRNLMEDVDKTAIFDMYPDLQKRVYKETEGLSLLKDRMYDVEDLPLEHRVGPGGIQLDSRYQEAVGEYYNVSEETMKEHTKALEGLKDAMQETTEAIREREIGLADPLGGGD